MPGQLVTVATFAAPAEAELARQRLQRDGIAACLADEITGGILGLTTGGLSCVKVQVSETDRDRAETILASIKNRLDRVDAEVGNWTCLHCGTDVSAEFEVCWSCGTTVDGHTNPSFVREAADPPEEDEEVNDEETTGPSGIDDPDREPCGCAVSTVDAQADNPYRAPAAPFAPVAVPVVEQPLSDTMYGDEVAARAWRAAVLGAILCPPLLTFYSIWLILKIAFADHAVSAAGSRKLYGAMAVNIVVWIMVVLVWRRLFLS